MLCLITGCVEPIVMDPGEEDMPVVVNCILTLSPTSISQSFTICSNPTLTLQYAKGKSNGDFIPIEDATVFLKGDFPNSLSSGNTTTVQFTHKEGCSWEIAHDVYLSYSTKYSLIVEIPGREPIMAETTTPPHVDFLFKYAHQENSVSLPFVFDAPKLKDMALWVTARMSKCTEPLDYIVTDHPYVDDFNVSERIFSELSFKGEVKDRTGYLFKDLFEMGRTQYGNFPLHPEFLRIGNLDYDGPVSFFAGPFSQPTDDGFSASLGGYSRLELIFATKDLDRYLRSVFIRELSLESELPAIYSTSNDIYTNVDGGLGIFGACYRERAVYISDFPSL